jgi:disulfide bond formation protein DsbB
MQKEKLCLYLAWVICCLTTLGSLYLSELKHLEPCSLCWYQRLSLFPLVILLAVALYKNFLKIFPYVIAFPVMGLLFSGFHIAMQEIPGFHPIKVCSTNLSCASKQSIGLGPISAPMLAFLTFLVIMILLFAGRQKKTTN